MPSSSIGTVATILPKETSTSRSLPITEAQTKPLDEMILRTSLAASGRLGGFGLSDSDDRLHAPFWQNALVRRRNL